MYLNAVIKMEITIFIFIHVKSLSYTKHFKIPRFLQQEVDFYNVYEYKTTTFMYITAKRRFVFALSQRLLIDSLNELTGEYLLSAKEYDDGKKRSCWSLATYVCM